jgi:hypothetical protein
VARTTVDNTVQRIRRQLNSGYRYETNYLTSSINSSATTLTLSLAIPAGLQPGAVVYVGIEAMRVTAVQSTAGTITVVRGIYDSDAAAHDAGDEVVINPRFSPLDIIDAMQEEIESYGPQLYRVDADEFTVAEVQDILELPLAWSDCYGVIDVRRKWNESDLDSWPRLTVRFQRGDSNWTTTSGKSILRFLQATEVGLVYVQVARPFITSTFTLATDLVNDVKLPSSMLDVVAMGTKLRLLVDNDSGRSARVAQDEPRRAEETPLGATVPPLQLTNALYRNRKQEEINKLRAMWPVRYA